MYTIENNIALYRTSKSYSQQILANKARITRPYLSNIENGKKKPSCDVALRIAKALEVSVEELFFNKAVHYSEQSAE
ncbi:helix-turn-helix transcriptional regulator [Clostridium grantii]|uniref:helix-turn-helix transcriptional regulator n=1 Tax=Clostridium grantii TaxID=40575 RepID=UPI001FA90FA1|nr:helix-turn-helix transcriptional regulator [Clostridium grantii]